MQKKIKENWKKFAIGAVIVVILIAVISGKKGDENLRTHVVARTDVSNDLLLAGEAKPVEGAEMAFITGGMVEQVYRKAGDKVSAGDKMHHLGLTCGMPRLIWSYRGLSPRSPVLNLIVML